MTETMQERVINAAELCLQRKGYEVLDVTSKFVVASDEDETLVFVHVSYTDGGEDFPPTPNRTYFERFAFSWLMKNEYADECPIRFDDLSMRVVGQERAFVRHHISCLA